MAKRVNKTKELGLVGTGDSFRFMRGKKTYRMLGKFERGRFFYVDVKSKREYSALLKKYDNVKVVVLHEV